MGNQMSTSANSHKQLLAEEKRLEKKHSEYEVKLGRILERVKEAEQKNDSTLQPSDDEIHKLLAINKTLEEKTASFRQRFDQWLQEDISKWNNSISEGLSVENYKERLLKEEETLDKEYTEWNETLNQLVQRYEIAKTRNDISGPTYFELQNASARKEASQHKKILLLKIYRHWQEEYYKRNFFTDEIWEYDVEGLKSPVKIHRDDGYIFRSPPEGPTLIGGAVWGPAKELARYLGETCAKHNWIRGKKVLDLSAGTGYVGVVAACFGGDVTITDMPQMLPLLQQNIDENAEMVGEGGGKMHAHGLKWGDEEAVKSLSKQDLIILSEIIYTDQSVEPLISSVLAVSKEDTELIVCQSEFSSKEHKEVWAAFYKQISKHFNLSTVETEYYEFGVFYFLRGSYLK